jgi:hypothetical protein
LRDTWSQRLVNGDALRAQIIEIVRLSEGPLVKGQERLQSFLYCLLAMK